MTDDELIEAMACEMAGHFGPLFEELPKDKKELRAQRRVGDFTADHTQEDMQDAAQAALAAIREAGGVAVDADLLALAKKAFNGGVLKDEDFEKARAMIAAYGREG